MAKPAVPFTGRLVMPLGIAILALFFLALALFSWHEREQRWAAHLASQAELQRLAVTQSQQALKRQALMAAKTIAEDTDTLRLIRRIAKLAERDGLLSPGVIALRAQLAHDMAGYWTVLEEAGANQLHVHLSP